MTDIELYSFTSTKHWDILAAIIIADGTQTRFLMQIQWQERFSNKSPMHPIKCMSKVRDLKKCMHANSPKSCQKNKWALTCTKSSQKKCKSQPGSEHIPLMAQKHPRFSPFQCLLLCTHLKRSGGNTHTHAHTQTHTLTHTQEPEWPSAWCPPNQTLTYAEIHQEKRLFQQKRLPAGNSEWFPPKACPCAKLLPFRVRMAGQGPILTCSELNWVQNGFGERNAASRETNFPVLLRRRLGSWILSTQRDARYLIGWVLVSLLRRPGSWILNWFHDWTLPESWQSTSARSN